jgi:hypothetical protein
MAHIYPVSGNIMTHGYLAALGGLGGLGGFGAPVVTNTSQEEQPAGAAAASSLQMLLQPQQQQKPAQPPQQQQQQHETAVRIHVCLIFCADTLRLHILNGSAVRMCMCIY